MAEQENASIGKLIIFSVSGEDFAVDIFKVCEVITLQEITHLPRAPEFVEGIINLRGEIIPVICLRKRFGLPPLEEKKDVRIIIVEINKHKVGLIVDAVKEVFDSNKSQIQPPPPKLAGVRLDLIIGVGRNKERLFVLLDLEKVLSTDEKIALEELKVER